MKNIAVIAVHGVADQAPCSTAREVADLLVRTDALAAPFYERGVRIGVEPVVVPTLPNEVWKQQPADYTFAYGQLTGDLYGTGERAEPLPEDNYDTICLSRAGGDRPAVHIYEMYWADLSRLSTSFRRIFGEFYQLLFHVSSLGRHTAEEARDNVPERHPHQGAWKRLATAQHLAGHVLTLPIPLLNLVLLGFALAIMALWLPRPTQTLIATVVTGIACAAAVGFVWFRYFRRAAVWGLPVAAITGSAIGAILHHTDPPGETSAYFGFVCFALAAAAFFLIVNAYDRRRPGARTWAFIIAPAAALGLLYAQMEQTDATSGLLMAIEFVTSALVVFWIALLLLHIFVAVSGSILKHVAASSDVAPPGGMSRSVYVSKIERVIWTGRLAVIMPTALFLLVTLAMWAALVEIAERVRPASAAISYTQLFADCAGHRNTYASLSDVGGSLMATAATPTAAFAVFLMALGAVTAIWAFAPCVIAEIRPPRRESNAADRGNWLDGGLTLLRWSGRFFFVAVVIVLPLGAASQVLRFFCVDPGVDVIGWLPDLGVTSEGIIRALGSALAGTAVALVAFRSRLSSIAARFRPVLDVALDVDNHLREHPLATNTRAKIAARYASLLRHVCTSGAPNGEPFDALVIVAHSQGTVITADLLRFLQKTSTLNDGPADSRLQRIDATAALPDAAGPFSTPDAAQGFALPVYLLTVGCPLRQLYGLRFPDLYEWARHTEPGPWNGPADHVITHGPDPAELNVRRWVNAYRSGDYVGRYLWRPEDCDYLWTPGTRSASKPSDRIEFCIGDGAHTHYFDDTVDTIGRELDELIRNA